MYMEQVKKPYSALDKRPWCRTQDHFKMEAGEPINVEALRATTMKLYGFGYGKPTPLNYTVAEKFMLEVSYFARKIYFTL